MEKFVRGAGAQLSRVVRGRHGAINEVTLAFVFRVAAQTVSFIVLARVLRPDGYGLLVALGALVGLLTPFAGFGYGNVLVKHISLADTSHRDQMRRTNRLLLRSLGPSVALLAVLAALLFQPDAVPLIVVLGLTELGVAAAAQTFGASLLAYGRRRPYAWVVGGAAATRLASALSLWALPSSARTPLVWSVIQFLLTSALCLAALSALRRHMNKATPGAPAEPERWSAGLPFSVGLATRTVYDDIDKVLLARIQDVESTAVYAAAYRAVQAAAAPSLAANAQMYPGFFRAGRDSFEAVRTLTIRGLKVTLSLALAAAVGVVVLRDLLGALLGPGYESVPHYVVLLAFLPLLQSIHFVLGDALTGMGRQGARAAVQVLTAVVALCLGIWLIPLYGIGGAVCATLGSELVLSLSLFLLWRTSIGQLRFLSSGEASM